ncbi:hypothetical protein BVRB_1g014080 [Beta vulgaris subsp. vulgaris]|nr:hypothetical protein BVRB_1g014080 [Beta vulgaris subsp. vulgaris]
MGEVAMIETESRGNEEDSKCDFMRWIDEGNVTKELDDL